MLNDNNIIVIIIEMNWIRLKVIFFCTRKPNVFVHIFWSLKFACSSWPIVLNLFEKCSPWNLPLDAANINGIDHHAYLAIQIHKLKQKIILYHGISPNMITITIRFISDRIVILHCANVSLFRSTAEIDRYLTLMLKPKIVFEVLKFHFDGRRSGSVWLNLFSYFYETGKLLWSYKHLVRFLFRNKKYNRKIIGPTAKMVNQGVETIDAFQQFSSTYYGVPPKQTFAQFLYNSKEKTVMGRTFHSWCK